MDDLTKHRPTTGGRIGVVILGLITGVLVTGYSADTESVGLFFTIMAFVSLLAIGFFYMVYLLSLEQQDKKAQDERTAQAATEYMRDRKHSK